MRDSKLSPRAALPLLLAALFALTALGQAASAQQAAAAKTPGAADAPRAVKRYTIEQFMDTTRTGGASFSDGREADPLPQQQDGHLQRLHRARLGRRGEAVDQLDEGEHLRRLLLARRRRFIYSYDRGGNENSHLYVREADGTERDLTPGEKTKANFLGWAQDGKSFFFSTNERDPQVLRRLRDAARRLQARPALQGRDRLRLGRHLERQASSSPSRRRPPTTTPTSISTTPRRRS